MGFSIWIYVFDFSRCNGLIIIDRWSDNIGLDRDRLPSWHYQPSYNTSHTMKSSDPLLLADGNLHCGMYPAGKVAITLELVSLVLILKKVNFETYDRVRVAYRKWIWHGR